MQTRTHDDNSRQMTELSMKHGWKNPKIEGVSRVTSISTVVKREKGGKKKMRDPLYSFGEAARPV